LVDYSVSSYGGDGSQGVDAFFDERLAIIQGIAHQTAVAVENIRLIKSQREEAYVSVALLQVAQAVVSSNDLKEALGAIVRITPILVGVERAAVFMWDKAYQLFRLVQSYGISREASELQYERGQFPILDAVYEEGNVLAYPLTGGEEVFSNAPDDWSFLIPPDIEEVQEYLTEEACLLLAFPLSVKGEPLGVFIVEEPHPNSEQGVGSGKANRRLRSKRMEIITGISQQAALAIQNDLLQREMVERERLEREMQLAREIQRTFLPQTLPDLPGWDLRVCWRTAHEVGGDFYDYFALPGRRFGLVIADVADKGMPAALFMTLVRTLVRAAVQQAKSPARVLERVNNLLVPDAPQGMFVTLAYAVLSLETGELELANAGHNPPLWVRCNPFQLERLHRGGMALGVIEGNRIEDRKLLLEPGDCLVMYTDGVTEAFSPDGDLFGEERLLATVETVAQCSAQAAETEAPAAGAQAMLEAIDQAVVDFIGEAARSDDLTLLVLKRLPPR
jgi:serine phosphatase RsbU (regulator of sigma subunit)